MNNGSTADAPPRRSTRGVARVKYAKLEARDALEEPPSRPVKRSAAAAAPAAAPPSKRAKRSSGAVAAAASPLAAATPTEAAKAPSKREKRSSGGAAPAAAAGPELATIPADARITLTRATSAEFCLNKDKHLSQLPYESCPNPHSAEYANMRLYSHRSVLALALQVHGGRAGLAAARAAREIRSKRMTEVHAERVESRRAELSEALAEQGLAIRSDSWLCDQFMKHGETDDWPLHAVVRRMGEMKYLHLHTRYNSILRGLRDGIKARGKLWDPQETAEEAEKDALKTGGYPAVWPWMAARAAAPGGN
jgi:hypothetical protein